MVAIFYAGVFEATFPNDCDYRKKGKVEHADYLLQAGRLEYYSYYRIRLDAEVVVAGLGPFPTCIRIDFVDLFDWCS